MGGPKEPGQDAQNVIKQSLTDILEQKRASLLKKLLPEYNQKHNYIRFQLNKSYEVYLRVQEEKIEKQASLVDVIPNDVL